MGRHPPPFLSKGYLIILKRVFFLEMVVDFQGDMPSWPSSLNFEAINGDEHIMNQVKGHS